MHDHGFAQHIVVSIGRDAGESGQLRMHEFEIRIAPARFRQQAIRRVEAGGRKAACIEPRHLAAAAAADIGGPAALEEEAPDNVLQIDRRRLLVPLPGERRRILVIGCERRAIHRVNLGSVSVQSWILEKSATARVAARISFNSFSLFSRTFGSSSLTLTLSKNASTAGRSFAIALIAPAKSSFATAVLASAFT